MKDATLIMLAILKCLPKNVNQKPHSITRTEACGKRNKLSYTYSTSIILQIEVFCVGIFGNRG